MVFIIMFTKSALVVGMEYQVNACTWIMQLTRGTWSGTWVCWATNQIDLDGTNITTPDSTEQKARAPREHTLTPTN